MTPLPEEIDVRSPIRKTIATEGLPRAQPAHIHGIYRDPTNEYGSKYAS